MKGRLKSKKVFSFAFSKMLQFYIPEKGRSLTITIRWKESVSCQMLVAMNLAKDRMRAMYWDDFSTGRGILALF